MSDITKTSWRIYCSAFKDGEHVVLEDDDGMFWWGVLTTDKYGIRLTRPDGKDHYTYWEDVTFMAHDGFPVRKIMQMSQEEAEKRAGDLDTDIIRAALNNEVFDRDWDRGTRPRPASPRYIFGGGCPFVFGPCSIEAIHNLGNNGPRFWGEDNEEVLVLRTDDGAICHSYDMSHLFMFDGLSIGAAS